MMIKLWNVRRRVNIIQGKINFSFYSGDRFNAFPFVCRIILSGIIMNAVFGDKKEVYACQFGSE